MLPHPKNPNAQGDLYRLVLLTVLNHAPPIAALSGEKKGQLSAVLGLCVNAYAPRRLLPPRVRTTIFSSLLRSVQRESLPLPMGEVVERSETGEGEELVFFPHRLVPPRDAKREHAVTAKQLCQPHQAY